MAKAIEPQHLEFLAKYKPQRVRYAFVYTEQVFMHHTGLLQAEPPPMWAAYLNESASMEQKGEGPWELLGSWQQTGVSHMLPSRALAIQWNWRYKMNVPQLGGAEQG
jgi:hypothetical protein